MKKWVSEARFLYALNYAMLLPGPEAQQLATYLGWLLHGLKPAVMALVAEAVVHIGKRALKNQVMQSIAGMAIAGLFYFLIVTG